MLSIRIHRIAWIWHGMGYYFLDVTRRIPSVSGIYTQKGGG